MSARRALSDADIRRAITVASRALDRADAAVMLKEPLRARTYLTVAKGALKLIPGFGDYPERHDLGHRVFKIALAIAKLTGVSPTRDFKGIPTRRTTP